MIKNIIFDFGNVIAPGHVSDLIDKMDFTQYEKEYIKNHFVVNDSTDLDLGKITIEEKLKKANLPFEISDEKREMLLNYFKYRGVNDGIIELAKKLKNNGYKLYLLSNHCHELYEYIITDSKFSFLDGVIVSSECHFLKPNKEIYEVLFSTYNLKPEECFFIDDIKENVDAGIKLGMKGHILDYNKYNTKELVKEMILCDIRVD